MRRQFGDHIGDGESSRICVGEDTSDERPQATSTFLSGPGFRRSGGADEGPDPTAGFEDAGALEVGIDPCNGVGIDAKVDGELTDCGKLIARPQAACGNGGAEPALELRVNRCAVARVNRDEVQCELY